MGGSSAGGRRLSEQLDDLIAALATGCGYVWPRDFEGLTLADCERVFRYWERSPPTYQVVGIIAQMLGWQPKAPATGHQEAAQQNSPTIAEIEVEAAQLGLSVTRGAQPAGPPPIFDLDAMAEKNRQRMLEIARHGD